MSRILKRPMFRKGGEVMEGIMTGIKPRKMFSAGTFSEEDQEMIGDVRRKMNLINAVGGGSGLSDPLTQFLLTAGPDLVAGKGAGGTKLQEILGGVKPGLDQAIKTQQLKDLSNRKLATQLIAKSKVSDVRKLYNALKTRINPKTGELYTLEDVAGDKAMTELYKKDTSEAEKLYQKGKRIEDDLGKYKDFLRNPEYNPLQKNRVKDAIGKINTNEKIDGIMDTSNPFISLDDYTVGKTREVNKQEVRTLIPNDKDDFRPNRAYFMVDENAFFVYNADAGVLVELPGV
jgi:hypothetical protein